MTAEIGIRSAVPDDFIAIDEIHATAIRRLARGHYDADEIEAWSRGGDRERFVERLDSSDVVVAEVEGEPVGFGRLDPERPEIVAVYVHPERGRRGVGRRLVAALEERARDRGRDEIELDASLNAVGFYVRLGYERLRERTHPELEIPCVRMRKDLTGSGEGTEAAREG